MSSDRPTASCRSTWVNGSSRDPHRDVVLRTPFATARTRPCWRVSRVMMRSASPSLWVRSTTASSRGRGHPAIVAHDRLVAVERHAAILPQRTGGSGAGARRTTAARGGPSGPAGERRTRPRSRSSRSGRARHSRTLCASTNWAFGISSASIAASANGWIGSVGCPTTRAGAVIARRCFDGGATRPKMMPWMSAATEAGRWSRVSSPMPAQNGTSPRGTGRVSGADRGHRPGEVAGREHQRARTPGSRRPGRCRARASRGSAPAPAAARSPRTPARRSRRATSHR